MFEKRDIADPFETSVKVTIVAPRSTVLSIRETIVAPSGCRIKEI